MDPLQKLQLEQSSLREKTNSLLALDPQTLTSEQRTELGTNTDRLQNMEVEIRAALVVQNSERAAAADLFEDGKEDGETNERAKLLREVRMATYLSTAANRRGLEGAARELGAAYGLPELGESGGVLIPLSVFVGPEVRARHAMETRALHDLVEKRAFTETSANDGSIAQRPILNKLFPQSVLNIAGVAVETIKYGRREFPIVTGGSTAAQKKEGAAANAAVSLTFDIETFKPKKAVFQLEITHEALASVEDLESAARRYMADEMDKHWSDIALNGVAPTTNQPQGISGFFTSITPPTEPNAETTFPVYAAAHSQAVDGSVFAGVETDVTSIIGQASYKHAASIIQQGSGESASEALARRSKMCRSSAFVPAQDASTKIQGALFHADGPNQGGGVARRDSAIVAYDAIEIIRDNVTMASQGIVLTYLSIFDGRFPLRAAAYSRQSFKLGA